MFYVDGHNGLGYGALALGRDFRRTVEQTRRREAGTRVTDLAGTCTLGIPEMRQAGIGLIFATIFTLPVEEQKKGEMAYHSPDGAREQGLAQLEVYERWIREDGNIHLIRTVSDLRRLERLRSQADRGGGDLGLLLLMENAEPIAEPADAQFWWNRGVRIVGPAWARNRYTGSSREGEGLSALGFELLSELEGLGMVLDLTHSSDRASRESLEHFGGSVTISHANARRFAAGERMIADEILKETFSRRGMFGFMPVNWAMGRPEASGNRRPEVTLDMVAETVLGLREIGGDELIGLGTDWDGGFGLEQLPWGLDSIADIGKIAGALRSRGAPEPFVEGFMGRNWISFLERVLPSG